MNHFRWLVIIHSFRAESCKKRNDQTDGDVGRMENRERSKCSLSKRLLGMNGNCKALDTLPET